ncbi:DUF1080 domain-containing protein [Rubellicoccus peritrichatus]|uniref:DUF1080 domain-containing protein n=1 Tax=Rubellicoccus peritrichatus TaxID=3080537 RepID=A0AAQ3QVD8_9BACT|nr:DUF1080 domain-containing protein [Puniceicoccus sp. CR14]WOO43351.1 DUF1080 domain-containing protein [Puniceicoccus sp. CR14]
MRNYIPCLLSLIFIQAAQAEQWKYLLDPELSQWEVFVGVPHETVEIPGHPPSESKNGRDGTPLGLGNDPLDIVTMIEEDGQPVLHITGQIYAGITTLDEFDDYHFSCQFKWGDKKWPPRLNQKRDSGVLFHCVGEHGVFWNVWMRSLECQIQEGDCGDFIPLGGAGADVQVSDSPDGKRPVFDPSAPLYSNTGYVTHSGSKEAPHGEWNTVEIYTLGQTSVFVVNGTPNMVIFNAFQKSPDGNIPLTRGKLQLQSEAAEIFYRDIKVRPISDFPDSLANLTKKPEGPVERYIRPDKR